jgi:hypothetical protein
MFSSQYFSVKSEVLPKEVGAILSIRSVLENSPELKRSYPDPQQRRVLLQASQFARNTLAVPSADLGRPGPVCPYVPGAISANSFYLACTQSHCASRELVANAADAMLEAFKLLPDVNLDRAARDLKCLLILFASPDFDVSKVIPAAQIQAKSSYIGQGLMIGEFFPGCPAEGLHNPGFRPFDFPVACLAVRYMTEFDIPFLLSKTSYLKTYLSIFGAAGESRLRKYLAKSRTEAVRERIKGVLPPLSFH